MQLILTLFFVVISHSCLVKFKNSIFQNEYCIVGPEKNVSWDEAEGICQQRGAHLWSVSSHEEWQLPWSNYYYIKYKDHLLQNSPVIPVGMKYNQKVSGIGFY